MSTAKPTILLRLEYEEAAQAYLRSLPLEHFMEATAQATQRKITLESLDLVQRVAPPVPSAPPAKAPPGGAGQYGGGLAGAHSGRRQL
jgi:hypothetical protein